jgi:hypothetical protein
MNVLQLSRKALAASRALATLNAPPRPDVPPSLAWAGSEGHADEGMANIEEGAIREAYPLTGNRQEYMAAACGRSPCSAATWRAIGGNAYATVFRGKAPVGCSSPWGTVSAARLTCGATDASGSQDGSYLDSQSSNR